MSPETDGAAGNPKPHVATTRTRVTHGQRSYVYDPAANQPRARSTLGFPLSAADELDTRDALSRALGGGELGDAQVAGTGDSYRRDQLIAHAGHRWAGQPLGPRHGEYAPGDVCGLRASAFEGACATTARLVRDPGKALTSLERSDLARELPAAALLSEAVPFFVPALTLLGIAGSEIPSPDLLDELRLPFAHVAVFFGADLALPPSLVGGEELLAERAAHRDRHLGDEDTEIAAHQVPPETIHAPLLALYRHRPVSLAGVVLNAGPGGVGLDELVMWLTVTDVAGGVTRRVDPGLISAARLAPIVHNLAAAVTWGRWRPPDAPLDLPADTTSPAFRDGLRRGHTRRQRVGPRDDWRYETRWIHPILVNPQYVTGSRGVQVYRLPYPTQP